MRLVHVGLVAGVIVLATGCIGEPGRAIRSGGSWLPGAAVADEPPVLQNEKPPFRYPADAWSQRIQGNVTLRLHVDAGGQVVPDSTLVAVTSGVPSLDSAALKGVPSLRFAPARNDGAPVAVTILFPVLFRHPAGPPLPGDSAR